MSIAQAFFDKAVLLAEALVFASAEPVTPVMLERLWQEQGVCLMADQLPMIMEALAQRYEGHAIELCALAGGWQFRTRKTMAEALARVVERPRRLSRGAMESLAVVAYHQPCTRAEIESIRGVSLGQGIFDTLLEEGLIAPKGRKEVPGRPVLWGTTPMFLRVFGLQGLSDLPRRDELVQESCSDDMNHDVLQAVGGGDV